MFIEKYFVDELFKSFLICTNVYCIIYLHDFLNRDSMCNFGESLYNLNELTRDTLIRFQEYVHLSSNSTLRHLEYRYFV